MSQQKHSGLISVQLYLKRKRGYFKEGLKAACAFFCAKDHSFFGLSCFFLLARVHIWQPVSVGSPISVGVQFDDIWLQKRMKSAPARRKHPLFSRSTVKLQFYTTWNWKTLELEASDLYFTFLHLYIYKDYKNCLWEMQIRVLGFYVIPFLTFRSKHNTLEPL